MTIQLAPENTVDKAHKVVMDAYRQITSKYKHDEFYLFGDSSGGGLALAFLQILKNKKDFPISKEDCINVTLG